MSFSSRITRLPHVFDPVQGEDALAATPWATEDVARLIEGAAGCSPYLKSLIEKESAWLEAALADCDAALPEIFSNLRQTAPDTLPTALRQAKRRIALLTGLADLAGVWPLETVTQALTDFADLAVHLALRATMAPKSNAASCPARPKTTPNRRAAWWRWRWARWAPES